MKDIFLVRDTPYPLQFLYYGTVFESFHEVTASSNATIYLQVKTGSSRLVHWLYMSIIHNSVDVSLSLCEAPTFTANGTASITANNYNRESSVTAQMITYSNPPDPTGQGTCISYNRIFGASGGVGQATAAAGLNISGIERLMKRNTDYTLKIKNNTTATTSVALNWSWYESGN